MRSYNVVLCTRLATVLSKATVITTCNGIHLYFSLPPPSYSLCPPSLYFSLSFPLVDDGAILDVQFMDFSYPPPDGYDRIMFEQNLL